MNRAIFYAAIRPMFGGTLSQRQVEGIDALLDAGRALPIPHLAHVIAEVKHETGGGMYPVKETVYQHSKDQNPSDAQVISRLNLALSRGQLPWVKAPYWRGGMFGRGQIQITHEDNYRKLSSIVGVDLVKDQSRALEPAISAKIAVEGCARGIFRGIKLSDFDGPKYRHAAARAIVNGDGAKKLDGSHLTIGAAIERDALLFEKALETASHSASSTPEAHTPVKPHAPASQPAPAPAVGQSGLKWWQRIIAAFTRKPKGQ